MLVNVLGSVMVVSFEQEVNAECPIDVTFVLLRSTVVKCDAGSSSEPSKVPQLPKAYSPMLVKPVAALKSIEFKR